MSRRIDDRAQEVHGLAAIATPGVGDPDALPPGRGPGTP